MWQMTILPIKLLLLNSFTQCYLVIFFLYPKIVEIRWQTDIFFIYPSSLTLCLLRWLSSLLQIPMTVMWLAMAVIKSIDRHACLSCCVKMKKVNKQCLLDTPRTVRVSE